MKEKRKKNTPNMKIRKAVEVVVGSRKANFCKSQFNLVGEMKAVQQINPSNLNFKRKNFISEERRFKSRGCQDHLPWHSVSEQPKIET